ncbi:hypothetical protein [Candidatus Coxiella mudrowiae]|uniref:hypothetical protein n=1 Tax=Candidatus Coxiella mudrowiae TaxID=2054173 RepID=UPI001C12A830|nr:hypothetical protein [Candidatus Coxiella mudrowiae]
MVSHNIWVTDWRVVITIIACLVFIGGGDSSEFFVSMPPQNLLPDGVVAKAA